MSLNFGGKEVARLKRTLVYENGRVEVVLTYPETETLCGRESLEGEPTLAVPINKNYILEGNIEITIPVKKLTPEEANQIDEIEVNDMCWDKEIFLEGYSGLENPPHYKVYQKILKILGKS
jgi:hypothetical protein